MEEQVIEIDWLSILSTAWVAWILSLPLTLRETWRIDGTRLQYLGRFLGLSVLWLILGVLFGFVLFG